MFMCVCVFFVIFVCWISYNSRKRIRTRGHENAVQDDTKSRTQHIQRKIIKLVTPYSDEQKGRKEGRKEGMENRG